MTPETPPWHRTHKLATRATRMLVRRRSEAGSAPLGCLYFSPGVGAMIFEIAPPRVPDLLFTAEWGRPDQPSFSCLRARRTLIASLPGRVSPCDLKSHEGATLLVNTRTEGPHPCDQRSLTTALVSPACQGSAALA